MSLVVHILEPRRSRLVRWTCAAVVVLAAYASVTALALVHWPEEEMADDVAGAMVVELAALPAATPVNSPDVAHGPVMQEAILTPQASKQVTEEAPKEMPKVDPSPALNPEIALPAPRPEPEREPEEREDQEPTPPNENPEQASAAPLTTAPPRVEAQPSQAAATPIPSPSSNPPQTQASWERALMNHLNRYKRYPEAARSRGSQGVVIMAFSIDRNGNVTDMRVAKSSGSSALDEEGLAVLQRASPLPAPPADTPPHRLDLSLPIQFRIR